MNHSDSRGHGLRRGLIAAAVGLCAATVTTAASAADKTAPTPTAPPMGGPGSLDGLWNNSTFTDVRNGPPVGAAPPLRTADAKPIPMLPWVAKIARERRTGFENSMPWAENSVKCIPNGMPNQMGTAMEQPLRIVETPKQKQITYLYEFFNTFRVINMDQKHPAHPSPSLMGDAVGHWEGDTLVVDTIAISTMTTIQQVIPHTEQLHLVERIRRTGPDTMEDRAVVEDPGAFTEPFTLIRKFKRVPGMRMSEFVCENNRNGADDTGATVVKLGGK